MNSTGQQVTKALRHYFSLSPRSRRTRDSQDLHHAMADSLCYAATLPGYFSEKTQLALKPGFGASLAYAKHVRGYRINGELAYRINSMTPWQFAALLGQMVDAGVTNNGEGERFFAAMSQERIAA